MKGQAHDVINLIGSTIQEREQELAAIFSDGILLDNMEVHLENTDKPRSPEKVKDRRIKALNAFSENPPEFWDMKNGRSNN